MEISKQAQAALFVDGNALFKAIDEFNEPSLKWLDLWALGGLLCGDQAQLRSVDFAFSATGEDRAERMLERVYLRALAANRVSLIGDDGARAVHECRRCGHGWDERIATHNEANLAIEIIDAAHRGVFNRVYLISDAWEESPLTRKMLERFPDKTLTLVCLRDLPKSRRGLSLVRRRSLSTRELRASLLDAVVKGDNGETVARPRAWAPGKTARWADLEITGL